jgi:flavin reductase (DIM6/NTAB) family NADH-FMN oxidoreductase RutF
LSLGQRARPSRSFEEESTLLRKLLGKFATGVTIVTSKYEGKYYGLTVNSFTSLSISPPMILISVNRTSESYPSLIRGRKFAVSFLSENQESLSSKFATDYLGSEERFKGVKVKEGKTGSPIIEDSLGFVECEVVEDHPVSDHQIFIAKIINGSLLSDGEPLVFYGSKYRRLKPAP